MLMSENENAEREMRKFNAETQRRLSVVDMKIAGFLIELIESKRSKLKQKSEFPQLLSISQRLNDLQSHLMTLNLNYFRVEHGELQLGFSENMKKRSYPSLRR